MKKVFLSLITIFMVLSLSVVLVKAESETTVELRDEISVRTDANVGIMWEGTVTNPQEGQTYGFLFAQGEVKDLNVETSNVVNVEITELLEENKFRATMVKFPKSAVAQDISVRTYVKTGDVYAYSEYVDVRNLAETVLYAKNNGLNGVGLNNVVTYLENNYMKTYNIGNTQYLVKPIYEYEPTELAKEFIKDWNEVMGQNIETMVGWAGNNKNGADATVTKDVITNTNIYKFFNNNEKAMLTKWGWLLDYIPTTANNSFAKTQAKYIKGEKEIADSGNTDWYGSQHLISRIENFFTRKSATTGLSYQSSYFTTNNEYANLISTVDGLTNKIYSTVECDFVKLGSSIQLLEQPELSNGYAWDGFTFNETLYPAESEYVVTNSVAVFVPTTHAIEYTITYKDGESAIETLEPKTYNVNTATFVLPEYSKELHEFNGWYDNPEFEGDPITSISKGSHGDLVLYAKTTEKAYLDVIVTFNMNGGGAFRYETTEEAIADFLKDYNTARGTSHTVETFSTLGSGTEIGAASLFLYNATYKAKWMWLVNYIATVASDANRPAYSVFYNYTSQADLNAANGNYIYEIAYELRGWVGQIQYTKNASYVTNDYSTDFNKAIALGHAQGPTQRTLSDPVELPTPKRSGYEFKGWYTNPEFTGEKVTQYPGYKQDVEEITYYAKWEDLSLKVTEVELSAVDLNVIESVNPTKYVNSTFIGGKYNINEQEYVYGETAFNSIAAALTASSENDIIYVFGGTYSDDLSIAKNKISIYGPNYNLSASDNSVSRNAEAILSGSISISASDFILDGFKFTGSQIKFLSNVSNIKLLNILSTSEGKLTTGGRTAVIASEAEISVDTLDIVDCSFTLTGASAKNAICFYGNVNNLNIANNKFNNGGTVFSNSYSESVRTYSNSGYIKFSNNNVLWSTANFIVQFANNTNTCTKVDILNNIFDGGTAGTVQFAIYNLQESAVTNIIGNEFVNWHDSSTVLRFKNAAVTTTINIKYNYFDEKTKYNLNQEVTGLTPVYENNYYAAEQLTATSDYGVITSKDALDTAYAEYLATLE